MTRLTPFLAQGCSRVPDARVKQDIASDWELWYPVIMGVATREDVQHATMYQLQVYNQIAEYKAQLTGGGADA